MAITKSTREAVRARAWWRCECPWCDKILYIDLPQWHPEAGQLHHIYYRSEYRKSDRDQPWNLMLLCDDHHNGDKTWIHGGNVELREYSRELADRRKPKDQRSTEKCEAPASREYARKIRQKQKEDYKAKHGGKSPWQVARAKQKYLYCKNKHE